MKIIKIFKLIISTNINNIIDLKIKFGVGGILIIEILIKYNSILLYFDKTILLLLKSNFRIIIKSIMKRKK
jgi:hypothetical protein